MSELKLHPQNNYGSAAVSTKGLCGRRIISCREAPAGTIGYTESSCSTRKSINTDSLHSRAERMVEVTSPARGDTLAANAESVGESSEIRGDQRSGYVTLVVEKFLPLADHARKPLLMMAMLTLIFS